MARESVPFSFPELVPPAGGLLALVVLAFAFRAGRRQRLIDDLPTCKVQGVFVGLVELKGTAESPAPLRSYLAEQRCVHYAWSVEEKWSRTVTETYRDKDGRTRTRTRREQGWRTVASGGETIPFYLKDDTGVILIRPEGATLEAQTVFSKTCSRGDPLYYEKGPSHAVMNSDHVRRFRETAIPLHVPLYVVGKARERSDIVAPEIASDPDAPLFLISTRCEQTIRSGLSWTFRLLSLLALLVFAGGWLARHTALERDLTAEIPFYLAMTGLFAGVWLLGWVWMAYNSLIGLRERVRRAWSLIDVQLKRRADLIPGLVQVVQGIRQHEREVQTALTALRTQAAATAPGEPGSDVAGCGAALRMLVEAYPEIKANESFLQLQKELTDTEQRIALARSYFNDIATHYNTRLETVPDRWIARLGRFPPRPLLTAVGFERKPVEVQLAE
jgi:hypothetical protein